MRMYRIRFIIYNIDPKNLGRQVEDKIFVNVYNKIILKKIRQVGDKIFEHV